MTAEDREQELMLETMAMIRREHSTWIEERVWLDDGYLKGMLRSVGGRSRYRRHGAGALALLKRTLQFKSRGIRRASRGFTNVADESRRVGVVLEARLGDAYPYPRHSETSSGSPSTYWDVPGRGGRRVVIRVSDHRPDRRIDETLIDISPTGRSAFDSWFPRRLDELGVGD